MKRSLKILPALAMVLLAQTVRADFDVRPVQTGQTGKIATNGFSDDLQELLLGIKAFGYGFEDPDNPFGIGDPGFNAPAGSLAASTHLFLRIESSLKYWNGTGTPTFGLPITGESVQLTKTFGSSATAYRADISGGSASVVTYLPANPSSTTPISALRLGTVTGSGTVHEHITSDLLGSDGNALPAADGSWGAGDGVQAADGVYAFQATLFLSTTSSPANEIVGTRSDSFWIVYNSGLSEATLDSAMEALAVPEPMTASIVGLGAAVLLMRRRK